MHDNGDDDNFLSMMVMSIESNHDSSARVAITHNSVAIVKTKDFAIQHMHNITIYDNNSSNNNRIDTNSGAKQQ